jgi:hypothetical protein
MRRIRGGRKAAKKPLESVRFEGRSEQIMCGRNGMGSPSWLAGTAWFLGRFGYSLPGVEEPSPDGSRPAVCATPTDATVLDSS